MIKRLALLAAPALLAGGVALADAPRDDVPLPVTLTATELDAVDGGFSIAIGNALAGSTAVGLVAYTETATATATLAVPGLSSSASGSSSVAVSFP